MNVNILMSNQFFRDHCSYSFVYPIIKSINLINDKGIKIKFIYNLNKNSFDCDTLIIDSRFVGGSVCNAKYIDFLNKYTSKKNKIIFSDTADNSGQLKIDYLNLADSYWKGQVLKNKNEYMSVHYGGRFFTNYYNQKFLIKDKDEIYSQPVTKSKLLKKIKLSWNMGLADHGMYAHIKQKLFSFFRFNNLISNTTSYKKPNNERIQDISCRIGVNYARKSVQFQREKISKILVKFLETKKIRRLKYLNEIKNSKFVVSPFGWGELCPRDFETFLYGAVLIKPEMETINTWPNWYIPNKTYIPFLWDLSNFETLLDNIIKNYNNLKEIAANAQNKYLYFTTGNKSKEFFVNRFIKLIKI